MDTWIEDTNGNRCSVEHFGSRESAQTALDSLKDCESCTNCSDCSGCWGCWGCSRCSGCSDCSDCSRIKKRSESATGTTSVPIVDDLHTKIYKAASYPGALDMSCWHICSKTHCRAGWVIALAGEAGSKLEQFFNTPLAAMKIYDASCPGYKINPARFFDDNDAALADMKALSEAEESQKGNQK